MKRIHGGDSEVCSKSRRWVLLSHEEHRFLIDPVAPDIFSKFCQIFNVISFPVDRQENIDFLLSGR